MNFISVMTLLAVVWNSIESLFYLLLRFSINLSSKLTRNLFFPFFPLLLLFLFLLTISSFLTKPMDVWFAVDDFSHVACFLHCSSTSQAETRASDSHRVFGRRVLALRAAIHLRFEYEPQLSSHDQLDCDDISYNLHQHEYVFRCFFFFLFFFNKNIYFSQALVSQSGLRDMTFS